MPPPAIAAGVTAAGALAGVALQQRGNDRALKAQENARQEGLAHVRKTEADAKAAKTARDAAYRQSWLAWAARVGPEGVKRYGVPVGIDYQAHGGTLSRGGAAAAPTVGRGAGTGYNSGSTAFTPGAVTPAPAQTPAPAGGNLGSLMGAPMGAAPGGPAPGASMPAPMGPSAEGGTLGDISGWEDWRRYGVAGTRG